MKIFAIMRKDLLHELRDLFSLFMMIAAPLLIAGLLYFAFGGLSTGGTSGLAVTRVRVADLDQGDPRSGVTLGRNFVDYLAEVKDLLAVSVVPDAAGARAAVDSREADAAIVIPADFSSAVLSPGGAVARVELYSDPALTLAPSLLRTLAGSFLDSVVGAGIAVEVTSSELAAAGRSLDPAAIGAIAGEYVHGPAAPDARGALAVRSPAGRQSSEADFTSIMQAVMVSMLVFFTFYTGASAAQTLVREREDGTLARLATTPTSPSTILAGKSLAIVLTIVAQVLVLLAASAGLFSVRWGQPWRIAVAATGLTVAATGFGLFLMSFVRTSQQVGPILGVGLTVAGMLGGLFTNFIPGMPEAMKTAALITPQGWASRLWSLALGGAGFAELALPLAVLLAAGAVFFSLGVMLSRRRFA